MMTKYEFIKATESVLKICAENGINPADYQYLLLFEDYKRMKAEGHKYEFICYYLSEQYSVSKISVYRIVKRFGEIVKM